MACTRPLTIAFIAGLFLGSAPASSQVTVVDEGAFIIARAGRPVGREEFSIRSTPGSGGPMHLAQATAAYGQRALTSVLRVDQDGRPSRYTVEVRVGTAVELSLDARATRGRVLSRVRSANSESEFEYVVSDGAVLVDDELFHQYHFLARRSMNGEVPVIVPRRNAQQRWRVVTQGTETITIARVERVAVRLLVSPEGAADRLLWVDQAAARVLRVSIPSQQVVATREEVPR